MHRRGPILPGSPLPRRLRSIALIWWSRSSPRRAPDTRPWPEYPFEGDRTGCAGRRGVQALEGPVTVRCDAEVKPSRSVKAETLEPDRTCHRPRFSFDVAALPVGSRCLTDRLRPFVVAPAALVRNAGIRTTSPPHATTDDELRDERAATVRTIEVGHHGVSLLVGGLPCR